jgi:hypothetical protein
MHATDPFYTHAYFAPPVVMVSIFVLNAKGLHPSYVHTFHGSSEGYMSVALYNLIWIW